MRCVQCGEPTGVRLRFTAAYLALVGHDCGDPRCMLAALDATPMPVCLRHHRIALAREAAQRDLLGCPVFVAETVPSPDQGR